MLLRSRPSRPNVFLFATLSLAGRHRDRHGRSAESDHQRERPEADGDRGRQTRRGLSGFHLEVWPRRSLGQHGNADRLDAGRGENRRPCAGRGRLPQAPLHRRDPEAKRARPRSDRHPHHLAARLEQSNANAFNRCIYIHGTAEEKTIGKPASYGCVRMCSKDVTQVYAQLQIGSIVRIIPDSLPKLPKLKPPENDRMRQRPHRVRRPSSTKPAPHRRAAHASASPGASA